MVAFSELCLLALIPAASAFPRGPAEASTFAGATSTFQFPPPGVTATVPDPNFPDKSIVGFSGPTPTGDDAFAIETAPVIPAIENESPIVRPDTFDHKGSRFDLVHSWGNLSPMFSLDPGTFGLSEASPIVPEGCSINAVHILHRHGARYPTSGSAPASFAAKIHSASTGSGFSATGPLAFLNTWTFKLGAEILTPLGRQQLFVVTVFNFRYELGVNTRIRYGSLLKGATDLPVWRTTSQGRSLLLVLRNIFQPHFLQFAAGFFGVQTFSSSYHQLIEIEAPGLNTTLAAYDQCANANNEIGGFGPAQATKWAAIYTGSTIKRLQRFISGVNLTATDIVAMQQSCAYESVALGFSRFCDLFTESEWESFEYLNDLGFWYGNGPGNPAVAAQGIGYVSEFISRLTRTRITNFDTSVNATIVSSDIKFPLKQPIFVDATHDTIITAVAVALNLTTLASGGPLPTDHIQRNRQWIVSHIAPFAANLVAQVLSCPASSTPTHIRWILNDAVVPLTGVKGCKANKDGLCDLVDYQFDCFGNYSIPLPDTILDGRFPSSLRNTTAA
ncbi:phosphoglycerate mutase-like protein [Multifurca ochricompacta]|uniref:Phosphoglycerate mutase-like protein n=1 Tax=Multifurca ochricompacta TaxID=376703 RepID=A0AAD4M7Y0_9AGAM|nr:phosphoglycerate mutase-like protein [Multifurca ochricompacta]